MKKWKKVILVAFCVFLTLWVGLSVVGVDSRMNAYRRESAENIAVATVMEAGDEAIERKTEGSQSSWAVPAKGDGAERPALKPFRGSKASGKGRKPQGGATSGIFTLPRSWVEATEMLDPAFMHVYIGLFRGVEAGVWMCGGELSGEAYWELGHESKRLGNHEAAYLYLQIAIRKELSDRSRVHCLLKLEELEAEFDFEPSEEMRPRPSEPQDEDNSEKAIEREKEFAKSI